MSLGACYLDGRAGSMLWAWVGCIWESSGFLGRGSTQEVLPLLHWSMGNRVENSREGDLGKLHSGGGI